MAEGRRRVPHQKVSRYNKCNYSIAYAALKAGFSEITTLAVLKIIAALSRKRGDGDLKEKRAARVNRGFCVIRHEIHSQVHCVTKKSVLQWARYFVLLSILTKTIYRIVGVIVTF